MRFACAVVTVVLLSTTAFAESLSVTTFAGSDGGGGYRDGTGTAARFDTPSGIAVDASGNVLVADSGAHTIRHVTPSGVVTTFAGVAGESGNTNGLRSVARFYQPRAVAVDVSGNVYVAEASLRRISPSGAVTTLVAVIPPSAGIAVDSSGNVFLTDGIASRILKVTPSGSMTTFVATPSYPGAIAIDGSNNLYFTASGTGSIYKCTPAGVVTLTVTIDRPFPAHGLDADASGNLYVSVNDRIVRVAANGTVTDFAGSSQQGYADGTGADARFHFARGVALSADGSLLYVSELGNHSIRRITVPGAVVTTLAGKANEWGFTDGTGTEARFSAPYDAVVAPDGNVYVANDGRIRRITASGVTSPVAGSLYGNADGTGTAALFRRPARLAIGYDGPDWVLYVTDFENDNVRKVTRAGVVTTIATGIDGAFGVAVAADGDLYVAELYQHTIRRIDMPSGTVSVFAGGSGNPGDADGIGTAARFHHPAGLAVDGSGNLFVTDPGNERIRKIVLATGAVTTYAGSGQTGDADGTGSAASFYNPWDILAIGSDLYVTDWSGTIRRIEPGAVVTTVAGKPRRYVNRDGTGSIARFTEIAGIGGDSTTNLYVTDIGGNNIHKVRIAGVADAATVSNATPVPNTLVQLGTAPDTATTWTWSLDRRPTGSTAQLSSTTIRNPTFRPDVDGLYTFLLRAEGPSGIRYSTVDVMAETCGDPLSSVVATSSTTAICVSGSSGGARVDVTGGMGVTYQWGYRTTSGGPITPIPFESAAVYSAEGSDFGGVGMRYLVATVTPACGVPTVSNELPIEVTPVPDATISASSGLFANSTGNFASVPDAGPGASYHWSINYGFAAGTITAGQGTRSITYNAGSTDVVQLMAMVFRNGCSVYGHASMTVQPRPAGATMLYVVTPCRAVDTRDSTAMVNGETRDFLFAGACGIPSDASAVVTNVTAVSPSADGWLALWPAGTVWGGTSTMNYRTGRTRANNSVVPLPGNGYVSMRNGGGTQHVIVDVTGYFR